MFGGYGKGERPDLVSNVSNKSLSLWGGRSSPRDLRSVCTVFCGVVKIYQEGGYGADWAEVPRPHMSF